MAMQKLKGGVGFKDLRDVLGFGRSSLLLPEVYLFGLWRRSKKGYAIAEQLLGKRNTSITKDT